MKRLPLPVALLVVLLAYGVVSCRALSTSGAPVNPAVRTYEGDFGDATEATADSLWSHGRDVFRRETFGNEEFWGGQLQLHQVINGESRGGIGPGLTPRQALDLGLKVDIDHLPRILLAAMRGGAVSLDQVTTTLELLKADAVVGVRGFFDDPEDPLRLTSIGITCGLCHSTVNDGFMAGIGDRMDGWPNRDLDVGAVVALAPNLGPFEEALQMDGEGIRRVLRSWGPGRYDAELIHDGRAFRPDGQTAATLLPAAFGLSGINLHTYTGWGSVTHWNAYVAVTQMRGRGTFFDPRLNDPVRFPVAVRTGLWNVRSDPDLVTPHLAALHAYQLSLPPPRPPEGSYDERAAARGAVIFRGRADCARCHVPPLFTEPGWPMHTAEELGIDDFQASRSPDGRFYRTTPLRGLFVRMKGGFYHDGRFPTLAAVVEHYDRHFRLALSAQEKSDLIEYLKSL